MIADIKAVFFDSGGTLTYPTRGTWWPKPRFGELLEAARFPPPDRRPAEAALAEGSEYLARHPAPDLESELATYAEFYRIVLGHLFGSAPAELVGRLAEAAVYDLDQQPYPDVVPCVKRLSEAGVATGIVSNAGPSLQLRYRDMGIRDDFDPFVLSDVVGMRKPSAGIYHLALDRSGYEASEVAFVDDVPANVEAAASVGMRGILIERDGGAVADLEDLLELLGIGPQDRESSARMA